jgi:photosystem II stability/assembly factor-like uncharacterized protein
MAARRKAKAPRSKQLGDGFKKVRTPGAPPPRFTYHKRRTVWFQSRTAWPWREPPIDQLLRERAKAHGTLPAAPGANQWELVGPSNIGGRMTCVACHPLEPEALWAGAAGGGVWHSADGGKSWIPQWHRQESLNVGAIAIDPGNPKVIYAGTGEANLSLDSYAGVGLYRTVDSGLHWDLLAASATTGVPNRIGAVAIDPFDSQHIRIGGLGQQPQDEVPGSLGGMWATRDGGKTWARLTFIATENYWCHAIIFDPQTTGRIYASFTERGTKNGIWRSDDGGKTWTHLLQGLPPADRMDRTALAIAPSDPHVIYALTATRTDHVLGVYRSGDGGATWKSIGAKHFRTEAQMTYGNAIVVHPKNPNWVLCGGVDLHRTKDGGKTWAKVTRWDATRGTKGYAHSDHHALLMPAAQPGRVYDMNDGGMDISDDGGGSWSNRSNGLAVTMFYDADVAQSDGRMFGGGAQDNGTIITENGKADAFFEIDSGDGGWMLIDPATTAHIYASVYNVEVDRYRSASGWKDVSPPEPHPDDFWMVYLDFDPADANTVFVGTSRVWRTKNDGADWKDVSGVLDGSAITAIDVDRADSRFIWVGTENGGLFRSADGGKTWSGNIAGAVFPGHMITRIESHPTNPSVLYAVVGNFGKRHVFRSADGGTTWKNLDEGKLPAVPHHSVVVPRYAPKTVYVANDAGIFVSPDEGATWQNLTRNLPNVSFVDLVHHEKDQTLTVATYGRSLWRIKI